MNKNLTEIIGFMVTLGCLGGVFYISDRNFSNRHYKDMQKRGIQEILNCAYSAAVQSTDTIDITKYKMIPQGAALQDSAFYAKQIANTVKNGSSEFIKYDTIRVHFEKNGHLYYSDKTILRFDTAIIKQNSELCENIKKYQNVLVNLAVNRRTNNQK